MKSTNPSKPIAAPPTLNGSDQDGVTWYVVAAQPVGCPSKRPRSMYANVATDTNANPGTCRSNVAPGSTTKGAGPVLRTPLLRPNVALTSRSNPFEGFLRESFRR